MPWPRPVDDGGAGAGEQSVLLSCIGRVTRHGSLTDAKHPTAPLSCPPKDQLFIKFAPSGRITQLWTVPQGEGGKEKSGDLNCLHCLALDLQGNSYASDIVGKRTQKFGRRN